MNARAAAHAALCDVLIRRIPLATCLPHALAGIEAQRERAFAQSLVFGALRSWPRLDALLALLLEHPLANRDQDVLVALALGLHQLMETRVPDHAAVDQTVRLVRRLGKPWAGGLANAVLRRFIRERGALIGRVMTIPRARHQHPDWLLERLRASWPKDWATIAQRNNRHPPMTLRINARRCARPAYLRLLRDAGLSARQGLHSPYAVVLERAIDVERLPGFAEGLVSVQDEAAQLAAAVLAAEPGQRVLDACAAPGGKTAHLLEACSGDITLTALDRSPQRLERLHENLGRLGLEARCVQGDATTPAGWYDGTPYQRILLDAPCSATGVIRRHPDIKVLRGPDEVAQAVARQGALLDALWPLLASGGALLYATCSVLPEENDLQIEAFLARTNDARAVRIAARWGRAVRFGRQILPDEENMDGFYYALLAKR